MMRETRSQTPERDAVRDADDAMLIAAVRGGSGQALAELYAQHAPAVFTAALRLLGSREDAIAALPDALRVVFVLREVEGYSHAEIAALLGITRTASALRLHRAWKLVRRSV